MSGPSAVDSLLLVLMVVPGLAFSVPVIAKLVASYAGMEGASKEPGSRYESASRGAELLGLCAAIGGASHPIIAHAGVSAETQALAAIGVMGGALLCVVGLGWFLRMLVPRPWAVVAYGGALGAAVGGNFVSDSYAWAAGSIAIGLVIGAAIAFAITRIKNGSLDWEPLADTVIGFVLIYTMASTVKGYQRGPNTGRYIYTDSSADVLLLSGSCTMLRTLIVAGLQDGARGGYGSLGGGGRTENTSV